MVQSWWERLPERFASVEIDALVIMPNHIHGIIVIIGPDPGQTHGSAPTGDHAGRGEPERSALLRCSPPTLGRIVQWLKTMTTNAYIQGVRHEQWDPFPGRLWQRNYYERVIRNQREWDAIREYIQNNPAQWELDAENPDAAHR
jgi:putative transposase